MKFAHLGDCHLGGWRHPELKELNLRSFQEAISVCIREQVNFVLISGDLFDSAYPPIDILKEAFFEFRKLRDAKIPVFLIAGSHDYSVSGKTFLDVLEKAGLCKNLSSFEERDGKILLSPVICNGAAIYGFGGRKSGLEVEDISKIKLQDSPGLFKILMLHTTIRDAVGGLPIPAVDEKNLPKTDYMALSHLHISYNKDGKVYSGPIFPNNISELEELKNGFFYLYSNGKVYKHEIKLKEVVALNVKINNALSATEEIISMIKKENLIGKILILKLYGIIGHGKTSDIEFQRIEAEAKKCGAFVVIKNTSKLSLPEQDLNISIIDAPNLEHEIINNYEQKNPNKFNFLIKSLSSSLQIEKLEDEKNSSFEDRLLSEAKKILEI